MATAGVVGSGVTVGAGVGVGVGVAGVLTDGAGAGGGGACLAGGNNRYHATMMAPLMPIVSRTRLSIEFVHASRRRVVTAGMEGVTARQTPQRQRATS